MGIAVGLAMAFKICYIFLHETSSVCSNICLSAEYLELASWQKFTIFECEGLGLQKIFFGDMTSLELQMTAGN